MEKNKHGFQVLDKVSLIQALRWMVDALPPLSDNHEKLSNYPDVLEGERSGYNILKNKYKAASHELLRALESGRIKAHGNTIDLIYLDQKQIEIIVPVECWNVDIKWRDPVFKTGSDDCYFDHIDFDKLQNIFPTRFISEVCGVEKRPKTGRPIGSEKEVWMKELLLLYIGGEIDQDSSMDTIKRYLADVIKKKHKIDLKPDTYRRNYLDPLFSEIKKSG